MIFWPSSLRWQLFSVAVVSTALAPVVLALPALVPLWAYDHLARIRHNRET